MAGASASETGQTAASPTGWTEEEERWKKVPTSLHMQSPTEHATNLEKRGVEYNDS